MNLAPVVLFVYSRPEHTRKTLEALMNNDQAPESALIMYADGPKANASPDMLRKIRETRAVLREKQWCKEVTIIESDINKGLADSIVEGVTEVVNKHGRVIVLEDDIVTSKGFLQYMNEALEIYASANSVMQIAGYMYAIDNSKLPETFFYNINSCWGWGTWKRAWDFYNNDALDLYTKLISKGVNWEVYEGYQDAGYREQLLANIEGFLRTWAIKWHTVMYLNDGLVLHPNYSLVANIGFDNSGENCKTSVEITTIKIKERVTVTKIDLSETEETNILLQKLFKEKLKKQIKKRSFLSQIFIYLANRV